MFSTGNFKNVVGVADDDDKKDESKKGGCSTLYKVRRGRSSVLNQDSTSTTLTDFRVSAGP